MSMRGPSSKPRSAHLLFVAAASFFAALLLAWLWSAAAAAWSAARPPRALSLPYDAPRRAAASYPAIARLEAGAQRRIIVTGGAGFVGSHLVDVLMTQGHRVIVVDNLMTGRLDNIAHWLGHEHLTLFVRDVADPALALAPAGIDAIYHLASPASPPLYQRDMVATINANVAGTQAMLELAARAGARLLFASTSEIYGDPLVHPQSEAYWGNVNSMGPRACYDEGKRLGETLCYSYARQRGVSIRVARIFNTFGPRMNAADGRVVSNFIAAALRGEDLALYGDGAQTRSFQYVSDLVAGLVALMNAEEATLQPPAESSRGGGGGGGGGYAGPFAVNLGNPDEYTVAAFADKIRALIPRRDGGLVGIARLPATQDDPRQRRPDIARASAVFGWKPRVSVDEGLRTTISYFAAELGVELGAAADEALAAAAGAAARDTPPLWISRAVNAQLSAAQRAPPAARRAAPAP